MNERALALNRRRFLECFSAGGLALMPGALMAVAQDAPRITREMLEAAAKIAGVSFSPQEQESILARLNSGAGPLPGFDELRRTDLGNTQRVQLNVRVTLGCPLADAEPIILPRLVNASNSQRHHLSKVFQGPPCS